jgi:hypothetical protein
MPSFDKAKLTFYSNKKIMKNGKYKVQVTKKNKKKQIKWVKKITGKFKKKYKKVKYMTKKKLSYKTVPILWEWEEKQESMFNSFFS